MVFTKDNKRIKDVKAWYKQITKRVFCISDTHGYPFNRIKEMLDEVGFSERSDSLYVLGDTIDRGKNSEDIRQFLHYILRHRNVELILGNHEHMALKNACLFEKPQKSLSELTVLEDRNYRLWMANGGETTLEMFQKMSDSETNRILELFREAPLYKEVCIGEQRFILCHSGLGGFDPFKPLDLYLERELTWYRPDLNERWFIDSRTMVVFGHTPTPLMDDNNQGEPIISSTWVNIDTGSALGEGFGPCLFCLSDFSYVKHGSDVK